MSIRDYIEAGLTAAQQVAALEDTSFTYSPDYVALINEDQKNKAKNYETAVAANALIQQQRDIRNHNEAVTSLENDTKGEIRDIFRPAGVVAAFGDLATTGTNAWMNNIKLKEQKERDAERQRILDNFSTEAANRQTKFINAAKKINANRGSQIESLETPFDNNTKQRALLNTISWAEGTWNPESRKPGYNIYFGGGTFDNTLGHPGTIVDSPSVNSSAAGAYQFLPGTWGDHNNNTNVAMTPENQDLAALSLINESGYDFNKPFNEQIPLLSGTWASIPNNEGISAYTLTKGKWKGTPQPTKSAEDLIEFYRQQLAAIGAKQ